MSGDPKVQEPVRGDTMAALMVEVQRQLGQKEAVADQLRAELKSAYAQRDREAEAADSWRIRFTAIDWTRRRVWNKGFLWGVAAGACWMIFVSILLFTFFNF